MQLKVEELSEEEELVLPFEDAEIPEVLAQVPEHRSRVPPEVAEEVEVIAEIADEDFEYEQAAARERGQIDANRKMRKLRAAIKARREGITTLRRRKSKAMWTLIDAQAELVNFKEYTDLHTWDQATLVYRRTLSTYSEKIIDVGATDVYNSLKFYDESMVQFRKEIACAKDKIEDLMMEHYGVEHKPESHYEDRAPVIDMELFEWGLEDILCD